MLSLVTVGLYLLMGRCQRMHTLQWLLVSHLRCCGWIIPAIAQEAMLLCALPWANFEHLLCIVGRVVCVTFQTIRHGEAEDLNTPVIKMQGAFECRVH